MNRPITLKVKHLTKSLSASIAVILLMSACKEGVGFQGGTVPSSFNGLTQLTAISPTSLQLIWDAYPGATQYKIYNATNPSTPVQTISGTQVILPASGANALGQYCFSVTATDPATNKETGIRDSYLCTGALQANQFFLTDGSGIVTAEQKNARTKDITPTLRDASDKTRVEISLPGFPSVTYRIYRGEQDPAGGMNWNNFTTFDSVTGASRFSVDNLPQGKTYCFFTVAFYKDGGIAGPNSQRDAGELLSSTDSAGLVTKLNQWSTQNRDLYASQCATTPTTFDPDNSKIEVFLPLASFGKRPTFSIRNEYQAPSGGGSAITVTVFAAGQPGSIAQRAGINPTLQTGTLPTAQSTVDFAPGSYVFYAQVSNAQGQTKTIPVNGYGAGNAKSNTVFLRSLPDQEVQNNLRSVYEPQAQQNGLGSQNLGGAVAMGDFDCNGQMDLLVTAPQAVSETSAGTPGTFGKILVYYNNAPNPIEASFDLSGSLGATAYQLQLGTKATVANFNQDSAQNNNADGNVASRTDSVQRRFQCDDVVLQGGLGGFAVLFGSSRGLTNIPKNGPITNPSVTSSVASCSQSSNICNGIYVRPGGFAKYTDFNTGDLDGDGYPDLISRFSEGSIISAVIFRGTSLGLLPPSGAVPSSGVGTDVLGIARFTDTEGFTGLGVLPNGAYAGVTTSGFYSSNVRDVLMLGVPNNAGGKVKLRVFNNTTYLAYQDIVAPTTVSGCTTNCVSGFGTQIVGIENGLGYTTINNVNIINDPGNGGSSLHLGRFKKSIDPAPTTFGPPGSVAIAAPGAGRIFIYHDMIKAAAANFGTPSSTTPSTVVHPIELNTAENAACTPLSGTNTTGACGRIQMLSFTAQNTLNLFALRGPQINAPSVNSENMLGLALPTVQQTASGRTLVNAGMAYLYRPTQGTSTHSNTSRLSNGFLSSIRTELFPDTAQANQLFAAGGIATGGFARNPATDNDDYYPSGLDVVIGAPGFTLNTGGIQVPNNGAVYFRYANPSASPRTLETRSYSRESNLNYGTVISAGDIESDGNPDLLVKMNRGGSEFFKVLKGRNNQRFDDSSEFRFIPNDPTAGRRIVPLGKQFSSLGFESYLATSNTGINIIFSNSSGIITGDSVSVSSGTTPRYLAKPQSPSLTNCDYLDIKDTDINGALTSSDNPAISLSGYRGIAVGDFNGDDKTDVAFALPNSTANVKNLSDTTCDTNPALSGNRRQGRVVVLYGGAENGFKAAPLSDGGYALTSDKVLGTQISGTPSTTTLNHTKSPVQETDAVLQVIALDTNFLSTGTNDQFAQSLGTVRVQCPGSNAPKFDALVIKSTLNNQSALQVIGRNCLTANVPLSTIKPAFIDNSVNTGDILTSVATLPTSWIAAVNPNLRTLQLLDVDWNNSLNPAPQVTQTFDFSGFYGTNVGFGTAAMSPGDLNNDGVADLVMSVGALGRSAQSNVGGAMVLFGQGMGSSFTFARATSMPSTNPNCNATAAKVFSCSPALLQAPVADTRQGANEFFMMNPFSFGQPSGSNTHLYFGVPYRNTSDKSVLNAGAFYVLP